MKRFLDFLFVLTLAEVIYKMEEIKIPYKQFVIVPKKPKMSKGKVASQVAHATFMALWNQLNQQLKTLAGPGNLREEWIKNGMCVIVLECKDELQLINLAKYLEQWKVPHHLYIDEGLYGCKPFTATALATGVLTEEQYWMFEKMRLFK